MNAEDFITLHDEEGNQIDLAILEYFLLDGQEYVLLSDMQENEQGKNTIDIFVMQVNILDDDTEEFVNIDTENEDEVYSYVESLINGAVDDPGEFY